MWECVGGTRKKERNSRTIRSFLYSVAAQAILQSVVTSKPTEKEALSELQEENNKFLEKQQLGAARLLPPVPKAFVDKYVQTLRSQSAFLLSGGSSSTKS